MDDLKRTGWQVQDKVEFVEVLPQDDSREHFAGDECWCNPQRIEDDNSRPVISHNSLDQRELRQREV